MQDPVVFDCLVADGDSESAKGQPDLWGVCAYSGFETVYRCRTDRTAVHTKNDTVRSCFIKVCLHIGY